MILSSLRRLGLGGWNRNDDITSPMTHEEQDDDGAAGGGGGCRAVTRDGDATAPSFPADDAAKG